MDVDEILEPFIVCLEHQDIEGAAKIAGELFHKFRHVVGKPPISMSAQNFEFLIGQLYVLLDKK